MAYDGATYSNNVGNFGNRKLHAKVIDNVLNFPAYYARLLSAAKPFPGVTYDYNAKILNSNQAETFIGLQNLNSAASDNNIILSYAQANAEIPVVIPLVDAIANSESVDAIPLNAYKYEEAQMELITFMGNLLYSGTNGWNGLDKVVDDGTTSDLIGGQSRTTYTGLKGKVTASGGNLTTAKLDTLDDAISEHTVDSETTNINLTDFATWSLFAQLINPSVRQDVGYDMLPIAGSSIVKRADLKGGQGFTVLTYRGNPVLRDKFCTAGVWFMLNERYLDYRGRMKVPEKWSKVISKIDLGEPSTMEGASAAPSKYHGFFVQEEMMQPNQAGLFSRYYVFGQLMTSQPRRFGKLTGITGI